MEMYSPLVCFLSSCFISSILLLKMPTMVSGRFSVIGPTEPIQASVGGEAVLPCHLSPPQNAQHMKVIWFQSTGVVHHYRDKNDHFGDQAPNYQGRTEMVKDATTNGNVSLKIQHVRLLDAGKYKCLVENGFHQEEADMELKVLGEEPKSQIYRLESMLFFVIFWILYFLWFFSGTLILQGFLYNKTSDWKDITFIGVVLLLLIAKFISLCGLSQQASPLDPTSLQS